MSEAGSLPPIFSKGRHLHPSCDKFYRANAKFFLHYFKIVTRYDVITYSYTVQKNHALPDIEYL